MKEFEQKWQKANKQAKKEKEEAPKTNSLDNTTDKVPLVENISSNKSEASPACSSDEVLSKV